ncbi:MAG: polyprenyl synthetase family protein [Bacteriovoracaceae bacterium]
MVKLQELKNNLDELELDLSGKTSSNIVEELNDLIRAGGKRFRPGLLLLMGKLFGLGPKELSVFARAVELTHLASLVHDDVIDESDSRRNHPTLNATRNNTTAILAGDFLLASVMGELALQNNNEILIDLTLSIKDLADGEWLQFDLKKKEHVTVEDLEKIHIKKTGSLIRWCCTTPAKLVGHKDIPTLATLGERIGLIFQMADDIVDGLNVGGRAPFQDLVNGQLNYVTLKLIELYPHLFGPVYEFRKNPKTHFPWTDEQYMKAIMAVHEEINFEKDKVLSIFNSLCVEHKQMDLFPIFEITINKIQSNYIGPLKI